MEVRAACVDVGFFYGTLRRFFPPPICAGRKLRYTVKNHGIPQAVIDDAIDASKAYFALPLDVKMKVVFTHLFPRLD